MGQSARITAITGHGLPPQTVDMNKIWNIESGGNAQAISADGGAFGLGQVRKPALMDWNKANPRNQFTTSDLLDPNVNSMISNWHMNTNIPKQLRALGVEDTMENRIGAYRLGAGNVAKGIMPNSYIQKYKELQ